MKRSAPSLALVALGSLALFPVIVVGLHVVQAGRYHPVADAVSVLALGRSGWLMAVAFCASAVGTLLLAVVLRRSSARARVGPVLLSLAGLATFVSAFVHADPTSAPTASTHGRVHELAGVATFALLIATMYSVVRAFAGDPAWRPLARPTRMWAIAATAAFFLIPFSGDADFGLAQRVFLAILLSWPLAVALHAHRVGRPSATRNVEPRIMAACKSGTG